MQWCKMIKHIYKHIINYFTKADVNIHSVCTLSILWECNVCPNLKLSSRTRLFLATEQSQTLVSRNSSISPFGGSSRCFYCQRSRLEHFIRMDRSVHLQHAAAGSTAVIQSTNEACNIDTTWKTNQCSPATHNCTNQ